MFSLFESLVKAAVGVVVIPVAVVTDVVTLGSNDELYTSRVLSDIQDNINNAVAPD